MPPPENNDPNGRLRRSASFFLPLVVVALLATFGVTAFWDGGTLDTEAITFTAQYSADRPLLGKVFDPHANDFGTYQARELSYFFDYLDATLYRLIVARWDASLLIPPSALIIPLLFALVFARGVRQTATHIDALTATLVFGCFVSCFVFMSTMGVFYRSGKSLVALTVLAFLFHVRRVHRSRPLAAGAFRSRFNPDALIAFGLALFAGLLDRQGVFYVLTASGILFVHYRLTRQLSDLVVATCAAAVVLQTYDLALAPLLIHHVNGYWPSFEYQNIPLREFPLQFIPGLHLLAANACVMLGGFWPLTLLGLAALGVLLARARARRGSGWPATPRREFRRSPAARTLAYVGLASIAQVVMFDLMIARHPFVYYWLDHRYWYYPFPYLAIVLFAAVIGLNAVLPVLGRGERRLVPVLLAALIVGNVVSLPHYQKLMLSGSWFAPVHAQSERLKAVLRTGVEDPQLAPNYRAFSSYAKGRRPDGHTE